MTCASFQDRRDAALGFNTAKVEAIRQLLAQPNSIGLVTGPAGSGKTTTLYAGLNELHREQMKIFAIEDQIEGTD